MPQSGIVTVVRTLLFWRRGIWMTTGALAVTGPDASDVENVGIGRVSVATVGRSSSGPARSSTDRDVKTRV